MHLIALNTFDCILFASSMFPLTPFHCILFASSLSLVKCTSFNPRIWPQECVQLTKMFSVPDNSHFILPWCRQWGPCMRAVRLNRWMQAHQILQLEARGSSTRNCVLGVSLLKAMAKVLPGHEDILLQAPSSSPDKTSSSSSIWSSSCRGRKMRKGKMTSCMKES